MSSISGFCDFTTDYSQDPEHYSQILASMNRAQAHRGPDGQGVYLAPHIGLAHSRPVSYTHLDVYKRQILICSGIAFTLLIIFIIIIQKPPHIN